MMSCCSKNKRRKIASNLLIYRGELHSNPIVELDSDGVVTAIDFVAGSAMDHSAHTEFYNGIMVAEAPEIVPNETIVESINKMQITEPIEIGNRPNIQILSGIDYRTMTPTDRYRVKKII